LSPKVSIIIVNWNAEKFLEKCISSLENQTYKNFEIIFVDNASEDNSVELVEKKFPSVNVIKNNQNLGFAEGNNIGIRKAKSDLIALFNPDAVAHEEWLSTLVTVIQSSDKIGAVAGKLFYLDDKFVKNAVFCTWPKIDPYTSLPYNFHDDEPSSKVDYLTGAAMLVKKEVISKIGLMDSGYFLYFEESDWCARMIRAGYDLIYVPEAIAWHAVSSTVSDGEKKAYFMDRSRIRFAVKNFDSSYLFIFYIRLFVESIHLFLKDLKHGNFSKSCIRLRAMQWNSANFIHTLQKRKEDMAYLKKNGSVRSYNRFLPLKKVIIPRI